MAINVTPTYYEGSIGESVELLMSSYGNPFTPTFFNNIRGIGSVDWSEDYSYVDIESAGASSAEYPIPSKAEWVLTCDYSETLLLPSYTTNDYTNRVWIYIGNSFIIFYIRTNGSVVTNKSIPIIFNSGDTCKVTINRLDNGNLLFEVENTITGVYITYEEDSANVDISYTFNSPTSGNLGFVIRWLSFYTLEAVDDWTKDGQSLGIADNPLVIQNAQTTDSGDYQATANGESSNIVPVSIEKTEESDLYVKPSCDNGRILLNSESNSLTEFEELIIDLSYDGSNIYHIIETDNESIDFVNSSFEHNGVSLNTNRIVYSHTKGIYNHETAELLVSFDNSSSNYVNFNQSIPYKIVIHKMFISGDGFPTNGEGVSTGAIGQYSLTPITDVIPNYISNIGTISNSIEIMKKTITSNRNNPTETKGIGGMSLLKDFSFDMKYEVDPLVFIGCEVEVYEEDVLSYKGRINDTSIGASNIIKYSCKGVLSTNDAYINGSDNPVLIGSKGFQKIKKENGDLIAPQGSYTDDGKLYIKDKSSERYFPIRESFTVSEGKILINPAPSEAYVLSKTQVASLDYIYYMYELDTYEEIAITLNGGYNVFMGDDIPFYINSESDHNYPNYLTFEPFVKLSDGSIVGGYTNEYVDTILELKFLKIVYFDSSYYAIYGMVKNSLVVNALQNIEGAPTYKSYGLTNPNIGDIEGYSGSINTVSLWEQSNFKNSQAFSGEMLLTTERAFEQHSPLGNIGETFNTSLIVGFGVAQGVQVYPDEQCTLKLVDNKLFTSLDLYEGQKIYIKDPHEESQFVTVQFDAPLKTEVRQASDGFYGYYLDAIDSYPEDLVVHCFDFGRSFKSSTVGGIVSNRPVIVTKDYATEQAKLLGNFETQYGVGTSDGSYCYDTIILQYDFPDLNGTILDHKHTSSFSISEREQGVGVEISVGLSQPQVDETKLGLRAGVAKDPYIEGETREVIITGREDKSQVGVPPCLTDNGKALRNTDYSEVVDKSFGFRVTSYIPKETTLSSWERFHYNFKLYNNKMSILLETKIDDNEFYLNVDSTLEAQNPVTVIKNLLINEANIDDSYIDLSAFDTATSKRTSFKVAITVESDLSVKSLCDQIATENGLFLFETTTGLISIIALDPPTDEELATLPLIDNTIILGKNPREHFYGLEYLITDMDVYYKNGKVSSSDLSQASFEEAKDFLGVESFKTKMKLDYCYDEVTASLMGNLKQLYHRKPLRPREIEVRGDYEISIGTWVILDSSCEMRGTESNIYLVTATSKAVTKASKKIRLLEFGIDYYESIIQEQIDTTLNIEEIQEQVDTTLTIEEWQEII